MNTKKIGIIFLALFVLLLAISAISADEPADDVDLLQESNEETILTNESVDDTTEDTNESDNYNGTEPPVTTTAPKTKSPIKTKVIAKPVFHEYSKKGKFKITIKNSKNKPVGKLKLNVKIYTGKKTKTIKATTNSKGIITISTKNLKIGNHKVVISSANSKYTAKKESTIKIGKKKSIFIKVNKEKRFKNGDSILIYHQKVNGMNNKGVYYDIGGDTSDAHLAKYTHIKKVIFYFKNKKTGKIIKKSPKNRHMGVGLVKGCTPIKAKVIYLTSK